MVEVGDGESKSLSGYLRVDISPREFLLDIMKTIPVEPVAGEMFFVANGIAPPRIKDETLDGDETKRYLKECRDAKVLPFLKTTLDYDVYSRTFLPKKVHIPVVHSEPASEHALKGAIRGERDHMMMIYAGNPEGLKVFNESLLDCLLEAEYQIAKGIFYFNTTNYSGNNPILDSDTKLYMTNRNGLMKKVQIEIGKSIMEKDRQMLEGWVMSLGIEDFRYGIENGRLPRVIPARSNGKPHVVAINLGKNLEGPPEHIN